ncbi:MAG: T9SS type A sorting domain-containing protein [Saprospiraceae bacterium]
MRIITIVLSFFSTLLTYDLVAQNKRDYQWFIGYDTTSASVIYGNVIRMDFRESPLNISNIYGVKDFGMEGSNTSMCDKDGNLLFYSNGCKIVNAKGEVMLSGDSINPGVVWDEFCENGGGSPIRQGVIALPAPEDDSLYYVFNLDFGIPYLDQDSIFFALAPMHLYYQVVDMVQDSGYGAVVQKNQVALADTLARSSLQAVRHANGKDWWVVVPKSHSNCYYVVPVTAEGVQTPQLKCLGHVWNDFDSGTQVTFSPDGKKYVRFNGWNGLNIFDFDAATGDLSNPLNIAFSNDTIRYVIGAAISPNSRYLYICTGLKVYQFDLKADDIESSKIKIATWDGYQNPYPTIFYLAALAPDGKIYISNTSSTYNLHVINKPNCPGVSCELVQHGIVLPSYNFATIPNMPHYRQSYFECDSTLIGAVEVGQVGRKLMVFPNPASEVIHLSLEFGKGEVSIFDATGRAVSHPSPTVADGQLSILIRDLPSGLYFVCFRTEGNIWSGKFVKQ